MMGVLMLSKSAIHYTVPDVKCNYAARKGGLGLLLNASS